MKNIYFNYYLSSSVPKITFNDSSVVCVTDADGQWQVASAVDNSFTLAFPSCPKYITTSIENTAQPIDFVSSSYLSSIANGDTKIFYIANVTKYNDNAVFPTLEERLQNGQVEIISSQRSTFQNNPSLEYTQKYGVGYEKGIVFSINRTIYVLVVRYLNEEDISGNYAKFLNSFKISN